jgi:hypothetical protein
LDGVEDPPCQPKAERKNNQRVEAGGNRKNPLLLNYGGTWDKLPKAAIRLEGLAKGRSSSSTKNSTDDKLKKNIEQVHIPS